jgi:hypothetical protein
VSVAKQPKSDMMLKFVPGFIFAGGKTFVVGEFMSRTSAFFLGALGGLLPILVSLLTVDLAPIIDHHSALSMGNYLGYGIRVVVLLTLGGTIAVLNSEVQQPFSLVQLGIAAPALVTSFINGVPANSTATKPQTEQHSFLSIVSTANAEVVANQRRIRIAGGFLGDIVNTVVPGVGTRLDTLNEANKQNLIIQGAQGPTGYSTQTAPGQIPPPSSLPGGGAGNGPPGNFCMTAQGRFGPGPMQPTGSYCFVTTPTGVTYGFVTQ